MRTHSIIDELLEAACPSIQYRIRSEILGQSPASAEMIALKDDILSDPSVQEVLHWQQPDGWLAGLGFPWGEKHRDGHPHPV